MNSFWTGFLVVSGVAFWVLATAVGLLIIGAALTHKARHAPALGPSFDEQLKQMLQEGDQR